MDKRYKQHQNGQVKSTKHKRPLVLIYYEAIPDKKRAQQRERYFKTSWGKRFIKKQLSQLNTSKRRFNRTTLIAKLINCGALTDKRIQTLYTDGAVKFGP